MKERIFISYKRVDKDRVFALKDGIEQATRAKCWIDLDGIESNAQFVTKIVGAIDECDVFIFMRSKEHNKITNHNTDWTIREVNYALEEHKNIVIVNLDNTPMPKWFKFMFPNKQEIDATDPDKLNRLNDDLCRWLGTAEEPVPQPKEEEKPAPQPEEEEPVHQQTDEELLKKVWQEMTDEEIEIDEYTFKKDPDHFGLELVRADRTICNAIIPNTIPYNDTELPVTSIGKDAFTNCSSLKSVTIPNSVTSISWSAFFACSSLKSITVPNSVTSFQNNAFSSCSSLKSIIVDIGNAHYDSRNNCNAIIDTAKNTLITGCRTTIIPNSITTIGRCAFFVCSSLTSITIPNGVTNIGECAFFACSSLKSITIPNSVTSIESFAFERCECLQDIQFQGTKKQWKNISKFFWHKDVPAKVVHCTDGDVKLGWLS